MNEECAVLMNKVSFSYDGTNTILDDISFCINRGESIGLIGANGAGKTTLMKLMLGLELNYTGEIKISGYPVDKKNLASVRKNAGFVLQDSDNQLFCHTVYQDVCFGPDNYGYSKEEVAARARSAMELTGCEHLKDRANYKLSGGEKKLAAIASILSMEPETIIMDEPESNLDPFNRRRIVELIKKLPGTKIIASHDLDFIWETTDKVLLIGAGQVKAFGNTKEILSDDKLLNNNSLIVPNCAIIEALKRQLED